MRARRHTSLYLDRGVWNEFQKQVKEMNVGLTGSRMVEMMLREVTAEQGSFFSDLGRFNRKLGKFKKMLEKKR